MNAEDIYFARLRDLIAEAERAAFLIGPAAAARVIERPLIDSARLRQRDEYERTVLAAKLPKTLLGRAPSNRKKPE